MKPISPYIYGMNFFAGSSLTNPVTLDRLGGNRWTGYNWETNASNAGRDWYYQNDRSWGRRRTLRATQCWLAQRCREQRPRLDRYRSHLRVRRRRLERADHAGSAPIFAFQGDRAEQGDQVPWARRSR